MRESLKDYRTLYQNEYKRRIDAEVERDKAEKMLSVERAEHRKTMKALSDIRAKILALYLYGP